MISQLIVLISAICFYFIGRHSMGSSEIENAIKKAKKILHKNKGQVIDYPTGEEQVYNESYEKKVDEAREEVFKKQFKP